ncbi:uncharacterized protein LOC126898651 [Daktulosphaira vitifoliae]|uniref:uncharacterized protein LOC126898651 n=1 Tax=Daktulosphaira vitifoliae TaxID=58002 RepID=UPI0021AA5E02|nr:uncharacterized protein LOC126898651 [Daktulosphaira vitifoliae]
MLKFIVFVLLCQIYLSSTEKENADFDSSNQCLPKLADSCFKELAVSLACHGNVKCEDPEQFCELFDDSLQCSADIIDGDCSKSDGIDRFNSWLKGLRAVHSYACLHTSQFRLNATSSLLNTQCLNRKEFITCVGELLNIHHVVDLLKTAFDYKECIRTIISMSNCNAQSQSSTCSNYNGGFLNDLIYVFFSEHKCNFIEENTNSSSLNESNNIFLILAIFFILMKNY